jgi:superfamily I DNA/RNA helicase
MPAPFVLEKPVATRLASPPLDDAQRSVVDHPGGPLLVLAGPGTGKTTTLVELVVDRVERGGLSPDEILVLTFSRKAADEIRGRIARRLDRTTSTSPTMTFHSFCYALLRREQSEADYGTPIRLLSAPEQDSAIAEMLVGADPQAWPSALRPALHTRGMAGELQRLMSTARAQGMDALDLETLGGAVARDDWQAAGRFFDEYTSVAALQNTIDYTDLVFQAVRLLDDPDCRRRWRDRFKLVVVDEYQDTDPLQVRLLEALAGDPPSSPLRSEQGGAPSRDLVVVGDPYQSIYGFRGADVHGILGFRDRFGVAGAEAPVIVLGHTNRYGEAIGAAVRSIVHGRGALGAVDGPAYERLRSPESRGEDPGVVDVQTYASATAEAEHIALQLREAHLHDGVAWHDMAVLVRSAAHLGRLQRALTTAGVPVEVAGDEVPLALEPSIRSLLAALHAADDLQAGRPIAPDTAASLLTGPMGGLDAGSLRRLGRVLRRHEEHPRASRLLIAEALADGTFLAGLGRRGSPEGDAVSSAARLAKLLRRAADDIAAGLPAEQVLWTLWDGTDWPTRLRERAESGGDGAAQADHDLDAMCALFAEAARAEEQQGHRSVVEVVASLESQQIPGDTLSQRGAAGPAVQLMTAHRSKGLEWELVVVAAVQDGEWPDVRWRSSLLQLDRLSPDGVQPPPSARAAVAEERRLFYVACSRARSRLVVTAVAAGSEDGDQPSRFVAELHAHVTGTAERSLPVPRRRPTRGLSLRGAVAELRRIGESTDDEVVRARVAEQLARLMQHPAARGADPARWWGLREITQAPEPLRDPAESLSMSGSTVDNIVSCPLNWFLSHEAKGGRGTTSAQGFGSIVHAIAAEVIQGGLEPDPAALALHLDDVWGQLEFAASWIGTREHAAAVEAIERFCLWHLTHGREVVAAEHSFKVTHEVDGRVVTLNGSMDRVEVDVDGVHVVDLKTNKNPPSAKAVLTHAQLGFYQLAVDLGATVDVAGEARAAGAELVQLRTDASRSSKAPQILQQHAPPSDEPFFAVEQLQRSVHAITEERFSATKSESACQYCEFKRVCPAYDEGQTILTRPTASDQS